NTMWAVFWKQAAALSLRVIPNICGEIFNRAVSRLQAREIAGKIAIRPCISHCAPGPFQHLRFAKNHYPSLRIRI
ncbi:MAG: hypothetical protein KA134_07515, partial [Achromobacter sp.]|nr:hypothetical protein [Achromobacter sp.]